MFGAQIDATKLGRFNVLELVGRGGSGVVYSAYDPHLDRRVALKLVRQSPEAPTALLEEARIAAKLSHPNIISVFEVGTVDDQLYLAMEYIEGGNLREWIARRNPSWKERLDAYVAAARGLAFAHRAGIVHCDFKPENVLMHEETGPRVVDFGLARPPTTRISDAVLDSQPDADSPNAPDLARSVSMRGRCMGTPAYMAPEQLRGDGFDPASDQFALCVSIYEALFGRRPFRGNNIQELARSVCAGRISDAPPLDHVPAHVQRAIVRGLSVDPHARWPSIEALVAALTSDPSERRRRWTMRAVGGITVVGSLAFGLAGAGPRDDCSQAAEAIDAVWNPGVGEQLRTAFEGTSAPFAPRVWSAIAPRLDTAATHWRTLRASTCASVERVGARLDLAARNACLDDWLARLEAQLAVFAEATPDLVERATAAIDDLPDVRRCEDPEVARAVPPPPPAERAEEIARIRAQRFAAEAHQRAGNYREALAGVTSMHEQAQPLGYAPLSAELALLQGQLAGQTGQPLEGARQLESAFWLAYESGHDTVAAAAAVELVAATGVTLAEPEEGRAWAERARAAIARIGGSPRLEARLLLQRGRVLGTAGEHAAAVESLRRATEAEAEDLGSIAHIEALLELAAAEVLVEDDEAARDHFEEAERWTVDRLGEEHPLFATVIARRADFQRQRNQLDEAHAALQRSLEIRTRALGPSHPEVARSLQALAGIEMQRGEFEAAKPRVDRALAIDEQAYGTDHPAYADSLFAFGRVLRGVQAASEAADAFRRAAEIVQKRLGPDHKLLGAILEELGVMHSVLGEWDPSVEVLTRAAEIAQNSYGPKHLDYAQALGLLGSMHMWRGINHANDPVDLAEAERHMSRALAIIESGPGRNTPSHVNIATDLARVHRMRQDFAKASDHLELALRSARSGLPPGAPMRVNVLRDSVSTLPKADRTATVARELEVEIAAVEALPIDSDRAYQLARLLWLLARVRWIEERKQEARTAAEHGLQLAEGSQHPATRDIIAVITRWQGEPYGVDQPPGRPALLGK